MNKIDFLKELQRRISVLDDVEQRDILDEYAQHIDTKTSKGMTEAEAIADFGPIDALVEELLGAYHVKASAVERTRGFDANALIDGGKQAAASAVEATKRGGSLLRDAAAKVTSQATGKAKTCFDDLDATFSGQPEQPTQPKTGGVIAGTARATKSLWDTCLSAAKTCLRWFWNFCVLCAAISLAICALCGLFALGFCVVLLLQGYPLFGISIAAFGSCVSLVCLTLLCLQLLIFKKRKATPDPVSTSASASATDSASASAPVSARAPVSASAFGPQAATSAQSTEVTHPAQNDYPSQSTSPVQPSSPNQEITFEMLIDALASPKSEVK